MNGQNESNDLYIRLASVMFDKPVEEITRDERSQAKSLTWSWAYSLRIPTDKLLETYHKEIENMRKMRGDK
jgi:hypothetical protein